MLHFWSDPLQFTRVWGICGYLRAWVHTPALSYWYVIHRYAASLVFTLPGNNNNMSKIAKHWTAFKTFALDCIQHSTDLWTLIRPVRELSYIGIMYLAICNLYTMKEWVKQGCEERARKRHIQCWIHSGSSSGPSGYFGYSFWMLLATFECHIRSPWNVRTRAIVVSQFIVLLNRCSSIALYGMSCWWCSRVSLYEPNLILR